MAYRFDEDLEFLSELKSNELNDLVYCLTHDTDGKLRHTEELTKSVGYQRNNPDHHKYWEDIAAEVQCFGANTVATLFRGGKGVPYREVLCDVCDKLKVNYSKKANLEAIEQNLLLKILTDALEAMSPEELTELAQDTGLENISGLKKQAMITLFIKIFKAGGFQSFKLTAIIVNAILKVLIGRGLSFGGNILLTRTAAILTGPIGLVLTGAWTLIDIAGPAQRVTIPAVIQIAYLRQRLQYGDDTLDSTAEPSADNTSI